MDQRWTCGHVGGAENAYSIRLSGWDRNRILPVCPICNFLGQQRRLACVSLQQSLCVRLQQINMPRSRGGARPAPRAPARRPAPPPQPVHHAPPPAPLQSGGGGMMGGLAGTIAQGMAFGTGSAIAHRAVDGVMGPRVVQHEGVTESASSAPQSASPAITTVAADACGNQMKAFQDCISANGSEIGRCQFYLDMLSECRKGPSAPVML